MPVTKKCYKMDRECDDACQAFRNSYNNPEKQISTSLPLYDPTTSNYMGTTNCAELFFLNIHALAAFKKIKKGK